jgi:hypothetical protein
VDSRVSKVSVDSKEIRVGRDFRESKVFAGSKVGREFGEFRDSRAGRVGRESKE